RRADRNVLHFHARGDYEVIALGLRITDRDGREWVQFVPLGLEWEAYTVKLADFLPLDASLQEANARLDPEAIESLAIGIDTTALWADKPGSFCLGEVRLAAGEGDVDARSPELTRWRKILD